MKRALRICVICCILAVLPLLLSGCGSGTARFEQGITEIPEKAFRNHYDLTTAEIPDTVTSIGAEAFFGCDLLRSVTIPDSVTAIGDKAFYGCTNLKEIIIPDSVTTIGKQAFYNCGLTKVVLPKHLAVLENGCFGFCKQLESVTIPDSVTKIGMESFSFCESLTEIRIPDSVTELGLGVLSDCKALTSVTLPGSLTEIPASLFSGCEALPAVTVPDRVTAIGDRAFSGCLALNGLTLPDTLTSIGGLAFFECTSLTGIRIPEAVETIGENAFLCCENLKSLEIHSGATLEDGVFTKCPEDMEVTVTGKAFPETKFKMKEGAPASADYSIRTTLGEYLKEGNDFFSAKLRERTSVVIPDTVIEIGDEAFKGHGQLRSVEIPDSVTAIGADAFRDCALLESVDLPDSVVSIGDSAFRDCSGLKSVHLPGTLMSIGSYAFSGCTELSSVSYPENPGFTLGFRVFDDTVLMNGAGALAPGSYDGAEQAEETGFSGKGLKVLPYGNGALWSDLYNTMPENVRTFDIREADCILVREIKYSESGGYVTINSETMRVEDKDTTMQNIETTIYLCFPDGRILRLGSVLKRPETSGQTFADGQIYTTVKAASSASVEEIWRKIGGFFDAEQQEQEQYESPR